MTLQFCPLFSSSSGNSVYVGTDRTKILIDAGVSCARVSAELKAVGVDPKEIQAILVTHEHADHISGVGVFMRKYRVPVYATRGTWDAMRAKLGDIDESLIVTFEAGEDFGIGDLNVYSFPIPHDAADPVGYTVGAGRGRVGVATDLGCVRDGWLGAVEGCDALLLEANHDVTTLEAGRYPYELKKRILSSHGHLSNDDAGEAAVRLVKSGVRAIQLGHLSGENNFPELAFASVACALEEAGIKPGRDVAISVAQRAGHSDLIVMDV